MTESSSTVLVVDDDSEIRQGLMDVLQRAGYQVAEASNGPAAVERAEELKPDLVFLDMTMPGGMDGADVAAELRRREAGARTPLVALSAGREPEDRDRALRAGCNIYLTKPCPPARIREVVQAMLDKRGKSDELGS